MFPSRRPIQRSTRREPGNPRKNLPGSHLGNLQESRHRVRRRGRHGSRRPILLQDRPGSRRPILLRDRPGSLPTIRHPYRRACAQRRLHASLHRSHRQRNPHRIPRQFQKQRSHRHFHPGHRRLLSALTSTPHSVRRLLRATSLHASIRCARRVDHLPAYATRRVVIANTVKRRIRHSVVRRLKFVRRPIARHVRLQAYATRRVVIAKRSIFPRGLGNFLSNPSTTISIPLSYT